MYNGGRNTWAPDLLARQPDLTMATENTPPILSATLAPARFTM